MHFDVVVIGAGHAGCEAALAAARLGAQVALVTMRLDRIAQMSCNPAIGGVGKGHLVREIDALGGAMAQVADATGIQFRRLNSSRGPAVQSTRCQSDSKKYRETMTSVIAGVGTITLIEDEVAEIVRRQPEVRVAGVVGLKSGKISCDVAIVTTGTFLNGLCHRGEEQFRAGRAGDAPATYLSNSLRECGLELGRFKTGTTPRLFADSIAWDSLEKQAGDVPPPRFAFEPVVNPLPQISCAITHTSAQTHAIIRANLQRSPLFQGVIKGLGPRYCPSIEDKVVRFADKERHQLFLEPEGLESDWVYPNGLSTSLPQDVQDAFLHSIPGLENCRVAQYGYAVEYDFAQPTQLYPSLMTKAVPGLFLAGQVNGTSGYEEAAAQGLWAGLNAQRFLSGQEPAIVRRDQAYLGVMIDDLVTLGVDEPYRLFTSRAEHRLTLRETNAEARLWRLAEGWGLLNPARRERASARETEREALVALLSTTTLGVSGAQALGLEPSGGAGLSYAQALKRPEIRIEQVLAVLASVHQVSSAASEATRVMVAEAIKYEGYIAREAREIARLADLEEVALPVAFDYRATPGLSRELREKLTQIRPITLGQASRIRGMTPAALALLRVHAKRPRGSLAAGG